MMRKQNKLALLCDSLHALWSLQNSNCVVSDRPLSPYEAARAIQLSSADTVVHQRLLLSRNSCCVRFLSSPCAAVLKEVCMLAEHRMAPSLDLSTSFGCSAGRGSGLSMEDSLDLINIGFAA